MDPLLRFFFQTDSNSNHSFSPIKAPFSRRYLQRDKLFLLNAVDKGEELSLLQKLTSASRDSIKYLANSKLFVCSGNTSFLADAFYNKKLTITLNDLDDTEAITSSIISEKLKLSSHNYITNLNQEIIPQLNSNIQFLHEKVMEL